MTVVGTGVNAYKTRDLVNDYQNWQDETSWYAHSGYRDAMELAYLALGITGEGGEFADQAKKLLRKHGDEAMTFASDEELLKLAYELSDVQWYVVRTCTMLGITPYELILINLVKLYKRINEREESGLGEIEWPLKDLPFPDALKLTRHIESRITSPSASQSTDTDT